MVDAAGTIYVIGGYGTTEPYDLNDVWVSIDGGADRTRAGVSLSLRVNARADAIVQTSTSCMSLAKVGVRSCRGLCVCVCVFAGVCVCACVSLCLSASIWVCLCARVREAVCASFSAGEYVAASIVVRGTRDYVLECVCDRAGLCAYARVCLCMRAFLRARLCVGVCTSVGKHLRTCEREKVCVEGMCVCASR